MVQRIRLGARRRRWQARAIRKRRELSCVADRTRRIGASDVILLATLRNEDERLPYFLRYYREMGIDHFLFVDNGSDDGSRAYLAGQPDVSIWYTEASYRRSRFGADWINWLARRFCIGHWTLTVDIDEFLVYPFCDTRPIRALTDWLDASEIRSFGAMMIDMYPRGRPDDVSCRRGQDPLQVTPWFDPGNYTIARDWDTNALWIQGGPRARVYFGHDPVQAPALNKVPLVKWSRDVVFASSTHMLLPRGLNLVYDDAGGEKASGCLLHAKFLSTLSTKAREEARRHEHYRGGREYRAYAEKLAQGGTLWCDWSERYMNWRQLEVLGLMSKGNWA